MIVMIDNYDSFTYNLVQYIEQLGESVTVIRNDAASLNDLHRLNPSAIVVSPGPGRPETAGISIPAIQRFSGKIPILGVCLGHQSIAIAFGGKVVSAKYLMHGKTSAISSDEKYLYSGIRSPFQAMRYHSLAVCRQHLPQCLTITSESDDGEIMGIRHKAHPTETPVGKRLLRNFLRNSRESGRAKSKQ